MASAPHRDERSVGFVCGDPELRTVTQAAEALAPHVVLPRAIIEGTALALVDKRVLAQRLAGEDVALPATVWASSRAALLAQLAETAGPWLMKPALAGASQRRPFAEKARRVTSIGALADYSDPVLASVILQSEIPGPVDAISAWAAHIAEDGTIGPSVTVQKRRERPSPYGSASWVITAADAEVEAQSRRVVQALGLTGLVGVEWKRHAGTLWFIEVNARPVLWLGVAEEVIVDAFQALRGAPRPPLGPVAAGRTWRYGVRDPFTPRADVDALWALDDPLPGLVGPAYTALLAVRRATGTRFG